MSSITVGDTSMEVIPGSIKVIADYDQAGGRDRPVTVNGEGLSGEAEVLIGQNISIGTIINLISGVGEGNTDVSWTDLLNGSGSAKKCLIDVEILGDGVQSAKVKWKGTKG